MPTSNTTSILLVPSFLCLLLLLCYGVFHIKASHLVYPNLQALEALLPTSPNQTYRTAYHFQPSRNWMNDPNGPMVYKGVYHFFYQYNPKGPDWGNIVWAHSTSVDLVNWTPHPPALYPSANGDINGCWSGSVTVLPGGKPVILYTGVDPLNRQVQDIAVPKNLSDPFLRVWAKPYRNPLMSPNNINQINSSSFRDPTTAWLGPDGLWRTVVGSKRGRRGLAILYRSKDFIKWIQAKHPLHSAPDTGMWECPDFYPVTSRNQTGLDTSKVGLGIKHVLKNSLDDTKHDYYTVGTYDIYRDKYIPDEGSVESDSGLRYDYGKFYASKTFYDSGKGRRILWGWINESLPTVEYVKQGWAGLQAVPRSVWLDRSRQQLVQWPVSEIESLRTNEVKLPPKLLKTGSIITISSVTAAQADLEISFGELELGKAEVMDPSWKNPQLLCSIKNSLVKGGVGPFGLKVLASKGLQEYTAVFFRVFKNTQDNKYKVLMCSDQSKSSMNQHTDKTPYGAFLAIDPVHEPLSLRSLVDHSIVESFGGGGKVCISARVYPTMAVGDGAHLYAFNYGKGSVRISKLSAWSMKKAIIE